AGDEDWPRTNIVSTIARNAATQRKISFIIERRYRTPTLAQKSMDTKRLCCPLSSADFWSVAFAENSACYKSWRIIGGRLAPRMDYKRQRIVPHETVRAVCASVAASKESFHIIH